MNIQLDKGKVAIMIDQTSESVILCSCFKYNFENCFTKSTGIIRSHE